MKLFRNLLLSAFLLLAFASPALAQRMLSGTVKDASGEGIPGAGILVKGTAKGAVSDLDGKWSMQAPSGEVTLEVSCLGYTPVSIDVPATQARVDIVLEDDSQILEETVVVGYGTQKR